MNAHPVQQPPDATTERVLQTTSAVARAFAAVIVKLRYVVIAAWAVAAVLAATHLPAFGSANGPVVQLVPANAPATQALEQSIRLFKVPAGSEFAVVEHADGGLSPATQAAVVRQAVRARGVGGIQLALPVVNTAGLFPSSRQPGTTAITFLYMDQSLPFFAQSQRAEAYAITARRNVGNVTGVTGAIPGQLEQGRLIDAHLNELELATLGLIALIVLLTYRSLGAPLVAMAAIGVGFPVNVWALGELSRQLNVVVPQELDPVVVALLLGVLTDYSIFFLSGVRARLAVGDDRRDAARTTAAEFMPIILTSAVILAASLLCLLVSTLGFFRDLGPALALTVGVGLVVAVTLVPALLATFGMLVYWPNRPEARQEPDVPRPGLAGRLLSRRWVALPTVVVCLAGLGIAAAQLSHLQLGFGQISDLPASSPPKVAAQAAAQGFAPGILSPTTVIIQQPGVADRERPELLHMQQLIGEQEGVAGTLGPRDQPSPSSLGVFYSPDASAARIVVIFNHDPLGASGITALNHLRAAMPGIAAEAGLQSARITYAGDTALASDTVDDIHRNTWRVAAVVLVVNLLLLIVFLRSLTAPLFLLASSVLAVGASLGLTTWVFQSVLGHGQLTYFVPFVVSVLLISLGSDYNIFVVGRIWQEARLRPLREAVAIAAPEASRAIRAAGITLAGSFALIAIIPVRSFREIAFAMVVGILIETFVVRSLLAPSLITVFGYASGWPGRGLRPAQAAAEPVSSASTPERSSTTSSS